MLFCWKPCEMFCRLKMWTQLKLGKLWLTFFPLIFSLLNEYNTSPTLAVLRGPAQKKCMALDVKSPTTPIRQQGWYRLWNQGGEDEQTYSKQINKHLLSAQTPDWDSHWDPMSYCLKSVKYVWQPQQQAEASHPPSFFTAVLLIACKVAVVGEMLPLSGGTSPLSTRAQMMRRKGQYYQNT